jgi:hypothetical protein
MNAAVLVFGIVATGPLADVTELVEVNHSYNRETGERRFVQIIYWDVQDGSCLHVRDWHMADKCQSIVAVHQRTWAPYTVIRQRDCGAMQVIRARNLRVTHTFNDPEEDDRAVLPVEARRPLGR